eukprot:TRINITY_DN38958_c0_g1_i1.p1 TRINITY_DN38958_c0_g1~~TRINITY_DN38958_c0_g1_i1.p1  ORF type:complete len:143 (-),score=2.83 TRINITY_DN38958_c0_g1_i1:141-521(-)
MTSFARDAMQHHQEGVDEGYYAHAYQTHSHSHRSQQENLRRSPTPEKLNLSFRKTGSRESLEGGTIPVSRFNDQDSRSRPHPATLSQMWRGVLATNPSDHSGQSLSPIQLQLQKSRSNSQNFSTSV